jgi:hypothetical protein
MPNPTASTAPTLAELRAQVAHLRAAESRAYDTYWRDLTCDEAAFQAWWAARQELAAARRALAAAEERGA